MNETFFLSLVPKVGAKRYYQLLSYFKTPEAAWNADKYDWIVSGIGNAVSEHFEEFKKTFDPEEFLANLEKLQITVITHSDPEYSQLLSQIPDPPPVLYVKGDTALLNPNTPIAIVGSRKTTQYGREITNLIAYDLAQNGCVIVSGLALGVDAIAHKAALKTGTIAVLGCGVDCCNPRENQKLYDEILQNNGLILSEYAPGIQPNHGTFPARNRIIAGLSQAVVVTEAAEDSGSLITADYAEQFGRPVFAVPGPITSVNSHGVTKLLKSGSKIITSASDILEYMNINSTRSVNHLNFDELPVSDSEKEVLKLLSEQPLPLDELSKKTKIPVTQLLMLCSGLELAGYLTNSSGEIRLVQ